jgi:hypothetical protein
MTVERHPKVEQPTAEVADVQSDNSVNQQPQEALAKQEGTALEAVKPGIPVKESWSYAGSDSTAVIDITILGVEDEDKYDGPEEDYEMTEWNEYVKNPKFSIDEKIEIGVKMVRDFAENYNLLINRTQKRLADRAIILGKLFLALKDLVHQKGNHWIPWAEENLLFIERRNREKYMRFAIRKDCHDFSFLGVDRLDLLCSATSNFKSDNPIGYLLSKYKIQFNPRSEENVADFKNRVDSALNQEKLSKQGFTPNFELVSNLTLVGVKFDTGLVKTMKNIRDCGGSPEAYLEKLSMNQGKDDADDDPEKRLQDFNSLANRLIKTVDYILKAPDQLSKVDKETFLQLWHKIDELQRKANLLSAEEQAA